MRIDNWVDGEQGKPTLGTFSIFFDKSGMAIHFLKITTGKWGPFATWPQKSQPDGRGGWIRNDYISFPKEKSQEFLKQALELARPYFEKKLGKPHMQQEPIAPPSYMENPSYQQEIDF